MARFDLFCMIDQPKTTIRVHYTEEQEWRLTIQRFDSHNRFQVKASCYKRFSEIPCRRKIRMSAMQSTAFLSCERICRMKFIR